MASLTRIQLCGRVAVELEGKRLEDDLPGRQGRLLFVYLVVNRLRPAPRDALIEALWPDAQPEKADSALSALLSKLRRVVGAGSLEGRSAVRLVLPEGAWVDFEAAGAALHRAEAAIARGSHAEAWGPGRVAQHISCPGLLPGEEAPWISELRNRLEMIHLRSLEIVAEACLAIGGSELDTAERAARSLVGHAPYRESGYRLVMEVLARKGNDAEALRVYDQLRVLLREQLGTAPSAPTQDLHRRLLA